MKYICGIGILFFLMLHVERIEGMYINREKIFELEDLEKENEYLNFKLNRKREEKTQLNVQIEVCKEQLDLIEKRKRSAKRKRPLIYIASSATFFGVVFAWVILRSTVRVVFL